MCRIELSTSRSRCGRGSRVYQSCEVPGSGCQQGGFPIVLTWLHGKSSAFWRQDGLVIFPKQLYRPAEGFKRCVLMLEGGWKALPGVASRTHWRNWVARRFRNHLFLSVGCHGMTFKGATWDEPPGREGKHIRTWTLFGCLCSSSHYICKCE